MGTTCDIDTRDQAAKKSSATMFHENDLVQMKPPAHPTRGAVVDGKPIILNGVRYWNVAWVFGGERRVTWSPESAIVALERAQPHCRNSDVADARAPRP